ncbi:MAG: tRNA (adenosine(37)-N6)-threonylcarbamoyltransferase complex dimerization subunit type 1 TsaB [Alphaproteobacteria bacterium]|nr:tRNA (adenosine(37)-N6)-threonylcarbamoyltransferase complex dimerization subunit type 1 TsaB [Alphaproteobacteria bacterium]
MILLALDAATAACSTAVLVDGRVLGRRRVVLGQGHAEALLPLVQASLTAAGLGFAALDAVAVTTGPGTFTGVRIGLAAARALALALARPMLGVVTLDALAAAAPPGARAGRTLVALIAARRGGVYGRAYAAGGAPLGPPAVVALAAIGAWLPAGPLVLVGDGAPLAAPALLARDAVVRTEIRYPDAALVGALALARIAAGEPPVAGTEVRPLYLRGVDTPGASP